MLTLAPSITNLGTESAFEVLAEAEKLSRQGRKIINLGIGQPDFKTPEHIVEAGVKALRDGEHGYTPANGLLCLREAIANDLEVRHTVKISPEDVVVVPGGKPTIFFSLLIFGGPRTEIIYPNPGFPIYESLIKYMGSEPVPFSLLEKNSFSLDAEEILGKITSKTRLIILNSPANPTGGITRKEELEKLVDGIARNPSIAVLSDEIYSNMVYNKERHLSLLKYPEIRNQLILLDGWSKTFAMTGWRLGYGVWPSKIVPHVIRLCINNHSCVNTATQYAGLMALQGSREPILEMIEKFDSRRKIISQALNTISGFSCIEPAGAFYAFPNIKGTGLTSKQAQDLLLNQAGVATIAGSSFGENGEGYLRLSYANSTQNILAAIDRIKLCI